MAMVESEVIFIIKELSSEKDIKKSCNLQKDLGLDSLGMVTLLLELEDALGIELNEEDMNPFELKTVEDVIVLGEKYIKESEDEK